MYVSGLFQSLEMMRARSYFGQAPPSQTESTFLSAVLFLLPRMTVDFSVPV